jgi:hypothetical protein
MNQSKITDALSRAGAWMDIDGVEMVAQGRTAAGQDCTLVHVSSADASLHVCRYFEGFPVEVVQGDRPRAQ